MVDKDSPAEGLPAKASSSDAILQEALASVAKGGALIFLGILSFKVFNFIRQFAIIRLLSPSDYGLFSLGMTVITFYMIFGNLGLYSGAQRYIAYNQAKGDDLRTRGVIVSTLRLIAVSTAAFTTLSILLTAPLSNLFDKPGLEQVILWFTALLPLSIGIQIMAAFFLGFKKPAFNVIVENIGISLVSLILVLLFLSLRRTLASVLVAQVLAHSLVFIAALFYTVTHFPIRMWGQERVNMSRQLLFFSLPLLTANALSYLMAQTDTLMLGYYTTSDQLGFYNAAYLLATALPIFLMAAASMMLPVASGLVAKEQGAELKGLYRSTTKWVFIFTLPLFLVFFLFPSQIMGLAFGGDYPTAARALQLLCLGDFVHTFLGPNATTLIAYGRSRFIMMATILATVINIALNLILTPRWGISGAATASFIALILVNIITSVYLFRRYRIHPFGAAYLKPVLILVFLSAALYLPLREMLDISSWLLLAYYPLLLALSLAITYLSRSLEPMDRLLIGAARQRIRPRKRS